MDVRRISAFALTVAAVLGAVMIAPRLSGSPTANLSGPYGYSYGYDPLTGKWGFSNDGYAYNCWDQWGYFFSCQGGGTFPGNSPSPQPAPNPTNSQPPTNNLMTLTLAANPDKVTYDPTGLRSKTQLIGSLKQGTTGLVNRAIQIRQRIPGRPWTHLTNRRTGTDGVFSFTTRLTQGLEFQAFFTGAASAGRAKVSSVASQVVFVPVQVQVRVSAPAQARTGKSVRILGSVIPNKKGTWAALQAYNSRLKRWEYIGRRDYLNGSSQFELYYRKTSPGRLLIRVAWPSQPPMSSNPPHIWGVSAPFWVQWS